MKKQSIQRWFPLNESNIMLTDCYSVGNCFSYSYIKPNNLVNVL